MKCSFVDFGNWMRAEILMRVGMINNLFVYGS
jgi:hypothetical protein